MDQNRSELSLRDNDVLKVLWQHWWGGGDFDKWMTSFRIGRDDLGRVLRINLSSCCLQGSPPPEIGRLSALRELYLGNNQLTSLPPEIGDLSSLKVLNLAHNQLKSLPPEIGKLSALQELYLSDNQLKSLPPPNIGSLLKVLDLSNNQLTSLPRGFQYLPALLRLDISRNCLFDIPTFPSKTTVACGDQRTLPSLTTEMAPTTSTSATTAVPNNLFEPMVTIKPTTFDDLKRTPNKALIEYCRATDIPSPIEGNRFAYISTPPAKLEFFPVSENLHTQIFPHHFNVLNNPIGFILSRQEGTRSFWHVVFVKKRYRQIVSNCVRYRLVDFD